jgi:eukaryotic-like serine/threonine-protein kinase
MDSARWEQIQAIFHDAAERPEHERNAFVEAACGTDGQLITEVLAMLKADSRRVSLLDRGLSDVAYRMVGAPTGPSSVREFGPYRLRKILGEGGMGVVWLAEREDTSNLVAIKFLPHAGLSPARRERFSAETRTLARLTHPYIARLYDAGALADGTPWFVMEYVEGVHLTDYCRAEDRRIEECLHLFRMVCEAVQYAHGQEIIHRDLKPSNILVEKDATPRLLDFGVAKQLQSLDEPAGLTRPGLRFASPDYAAPEWVSDGSVGLYTDVYSLGVILYEMITGRLPFGRSKEAPEGVSPVKDNPDKPSSVVNRLPGTKNPFALLRKAAWNDLDVLCLKAMHQDARERYQSVEALIRDVDHYVKGEPLEARPDTLSYRLGKFVARNRPAVLAAALSFTLLAGLIVFFTLRLAKERDRANRETAAATSMNRFLADDLLAQSDPFKSGKAQESFADVVNQASLHIDAQFLANPLVAARLHQTIAKAFDSRSDFPPARREYDRASQLFRQADGPLSQDAILAGLQRAAMEARSYERGSLDLAKSLLKDAETAISSIAKPREDLEVYLLSTRGIIALTDNDPRSANQDFLAALHKAESLPSFDDAARRRIKRTVAFSYIRLGDGARAESLFRDLIRELSRAAGPDSPNTLQARINLSQSLFIQAKYAEAIKEANLIYPLLVQKLGEDHETAMTVLGTRAASEGSLGMWDDAIRDDLTIYHLALRKQGPVSVFSIAMLSDAALSQCRAGRYAEGEANARNAFEHSRQAFGARAGITGGSSYALAVCLVGSNKLEEASALLRNIDAKAVGQLTGDTTIDASIALAQGEIAARRGDYILAQHYVETAAPVFQRPNTGAGEKQSLQTLQSVIDAHLRNTR